MLNIPEGSPLQTWLDHQDRQRAIRRIARAVAQALQLHVDNSALVLAPPLGQPITLDNRQALEQWVEETLIELSLTADTEAVEPLCHRLVQRLEEAY